MIKEAEGVSEWRRQKRMKRKSSQLSRKCTRSKLLDGSGQDKLSCSLNQAVRFVLERQGLVDRFHVVSPKNKCKRKGRSNSTESHLSSFEPLMPLHATGQTTPPLSLLARVHDFKEKHLGRFLAESRKSPLHYPMLRCMRSTLHLVPASKYHFIAGLYNFEGCKAVDDKLQRFEMSSQEYEAISKRIMTILSRIGPMHTQALTASLKSEEKSSTTYKVRKLTMQAGKTTVTQSNVSIALYALFGEGRLQHGLTTLSSTSSSCDDDELPLELWRETRRLHGVAALARPISQLKNERTTVVHEIVDASAIVEKAAVISQDSHLLEMMRWYFELYSPASLQDFVWWSGRKVRESRIALETLQEEQELVEIYVNGLSCVCYVWASHQDVLLNTEDSLPSGIRFLPYEDAVIKAYKETRHRFYFVKGGNNNKNEVIANENLRELIFWNGEAHPTIWIDGQIVGRWSWKNIKNNEQSKKSKKEDESAAVITVTTQYQLTKKMKSRLTSELEILCDMMNCSPKSDLEFLVQQESDKSNCIIRV